MSHIAMQALGLIFAALIFWRAEMVLNLMAPGCRFAVRLSFWLLVVGAAGVAVGIWQGYVPPAAVLICMAGTALLLVSERRIRGILRIHTPVLRDRRAKP